MTEDNELVERAAKVLYEYDGGLSLQTCIDYAASVIAAVRAHDREQRAKIDEALAYQTKMDGLINKLDQLTYTQDSTRIITGADGRDRLVSKVSRVSRNEDGSPKIEPVSQNEYLMPADPDDYRDPFTLATRMAKGPGIGG